MENPWLTIVEIMEKTLDGCSMLSEKDGTSYIWLGSEMCGPSFWPEISDVGAPVGHGLVRIC